MIKIKNDSGVTKVWVGQTVLDQNEYTIQDHEIFQWADNSTLLTDIGNSDALVGDGAQYFSDVNQGIDYLKGTPAPADNDGAPLVRSRAFANADGFRARFTGIQGTATKNTLSNIDYKLTETRYINGVRLILASHVDGDKVDFQVVDVDNILGYGAGTVLDEFGKDWYIDAGVCTQPDVIVPYPAQVLVDLYIRVVYHSTGTQNDVNVRANLFLHKKTT